MKKLMIHIEAPGSTEKNLHFGATVVAMFNPGKLVFSRTVQWKSQWSAKRDVPESQFTGGDPTVLSVELLFDTYDVPEREKHSVRKVYIEKLLGLTTVENHGGIHRPPICRLSWGDEGVLFQGVLQQIETQYTMFSEGGIPVRATARCSFKQWVANGADLRRQKLMSSDVAKVWIVKRGETLEGIAAAEYGDPRQWRLIAESNAIDNPLAVAPGTRLLLPPRKVALRLETA